MRSATFTDLFFEQNLSSWQDFINLLMKKDYNSSALWRGQADANWEIVSSYTRDIECEIKKNKPDGSTDYNEKVLRLREAKARWLSSHYRELLFNSPRAVIGERINTIKYLFDPPAAEWCSYDLYLKKYNLFANKRVIGLNEQTIQLAGSCYDITFGVDIDLSKWTWGQHYGVATPLVDWTRCALMALFFACCIECDADKIAVYSLNIRTLGHVNQITVPPQMTSADIFHASEEVRKQLRQFFLTFFEGLPIENIIYQEIYPEKCLSVFHFLSDMKKLKLLGNDWEDDSNSRMNAQAAFFTFTPGGISIEDWCKRFYKVHQGGILFEEYQVPMLTKYIIPMTRDEKQSCMQFLENANINFKTVYPDFQGISKYLEQKAKQYDDLMTSENGEQPDPSGTAGEEPDNA